MKVIKKKPFATAEAHHDFPWQFQQWFAKHGLDVNEPAFGRWVSEFDHIAWHNKMMPKFNDFWDNFWQQERIQIMNGGPPFTKQEIIDKLAEARALYPVINGQ